MMVGTDLQGFVSPHQDPDCSLLFVFEQLHVTGASLLPLWWVVLRCKAIQFRSPVCHERKRLDGEMIRQSRGGEQKQATYILKSSSSSSSNVFTSCSGRDTMGS